MIVIGKYSNESQLPRHSQRDSLVDFLHHHLGQFGDSKQAINKCLDYAFSSNEGMGGFVLTAHSQNQLSGVVIMNRTGMSEYIPEYILVYIAVDERQRNQGIGRQLMERVFEETGNAPIALHVEYENPAKRLYERMGFTTKYAEMRRVNI